MSNNITKEELSASTEATSKSVVLFEKILLTQEQLIERQEKITARLYNGLAKDIADSVSLKCNTQLEETKKQLSLIQTNLNSTEEEGTIASRLQTIAGDGKANRGFSEKVLWIVTAISIVTASATVILRGIDNRSLFKEEIKKIVIETMKDCK